ncbi:unnamed protein product [Lymnaea stagnalis]|uniref:EVA1 domain-containing protein n=1 Tax=Lymnaea stagnalis TaxID=6523 RepID=A0AAV2I4A7_LYMST
MGTHKYLTVSYACVPRKILKQIHQKKNRKKKKKKKKKDQEKVTKLPRDDNFTDISSSTQSASDISSAPSLPEVYVTFEQLPVTKVGEEAVTTGSVRQEENQKSSTHLDDKATDDTTVQDKIPGLDDVTSVDERTSELDVSTVHREASNFDDVIITEPSTEDSSTDTNKKTNDEVYYKSFEDITTSVILSPSSADQHKDNKDDSGSRQPNGNNAGHVRESGEEFDNSRPHSGSSNNTNHVENEDNNSFEEDTSVVSPTRSPPVETTYSTVSTNIHKDTGPDHESVSNSNYTMEKKDSPFVTERNLTVLCMNYTRPDVRWGGMQRPRDHRTIGFLKDWLSICHYLKTHEEKAWLYFTLGICFGIIVMLVVVLVKVCCNFRRNIRARLDVSEPTHRSAHINNHSSLDAPMLEHSDSMDRIEVVRFSPRSTLRSLRSNSHNRDLVNYYG